jgi:Tfp pilus assembly protein PilF
MNLGNVLRARRRLNDALRHYQQALRIDPGSALAHYNLGIALEARGQRDEAQGHYQQALQIDPTLAEAHINLGIGLARKGRLDEAISHFRQAVRLAPREAIGHCNLGIALQQQGNFAEAVASLKRGHELGSKSPLWRYPSGKWLAQAERLAAREKLLPTVLQGKHKANAAELLQFGELALVTKRYAAAARLHADAFAADARLADRLQESHRYNAACAAVRAAGSEGADAGTLDDRERERWRQQALEPTLPHGRRCRTGPWCRKCSSIGSARPPWPACATRWRWPNCPRSSAVSGINSGPTWPTCYRK